MSVREKIGQLIALGVNAKFLSQDSDAYRTLRRQIEDNHVGGIVLYHGSVLEGIHISNRLQALSRYPLLVSADMEYGAAMRFDDTASLPTNMAVAATGKYENARRQGEIIAQEARALGVRQIFGPVVDVNTNPANPIINVRAYGEDPQEVAKFSSAFISGAQANGVIATAKHFPGHGDAIIDSHRGLPMVNFDRARLNEVELVPYRAAIATDVGSVMASFIALPNIDPTPIKPLAGDRRTGPSYVVQGGELPASNATLPAALSPIIGRLLREDLRFEGLVATDALDMSALTIYFNQDEAAVRAIEAGADILVKPSDPDLAATGLLHAVATGRITEKRIDQSVRRILAAKYDLGLVHQRMTSLNEVDQLLSNLHVVAVARQIAREAITLVRNDNNLLPLTIRPHAKIFNLAVTNGDDRLTIAAPFAAEMTRQGLQIETVVLDARSSLKEIEDATEKANESDLVILSLYCRVIAGDAASVGVPPSTTKAINRLLFAKPRVVGITFGNPYLLQTFPQLKTYIVAYGDMPSLQEAAAQALLGKNSITGKLPITLDVKEEGRPIIRFHSGFGVMLQQEK
jgi:beta-N-acetylhexosaminidase